MKHSILACLFVGTALSVTGAFAVKPGVKRAKNAVKAVPLPAKPTAKLPTPRSHLGATEPISCQKLDMCLARAGTKETSESALKTCVQTFCEELQKEDGLNMSESRQALCNEKGKKVWGILSKASMGGSPIELMADGKISLVALHSSRPDTYAAVVHLLFAQGSTVTQMAKACRTEPAPVKPTVQSPKPYGNPEAGPAKAPKEVVLAKPPVASSHSVPSKSTAKLPTPPGHPESGTVRAIKVAVPPTPNMTVPKPHGQAGSKSTEPATCKKLDACLAAAHGDDKEKSASAFKACIDSFCKELHKDTHFNKSDSRTALCDKKGKEAWDILAKALFDVKLNRKASFTALHSQRPDTYAAVMHVFFTQSSEVSHMDSVCRVHGHSAASQLASRRHSMRGPPKKEKNLRPIGEGAHQDPKAVQQRTKEKNMDCEEGNWNDCHGPNGDYTNSSNFPKPTKKSGAAPMTSSIGVTMAIIFAIGQ